MPYHFGGLRLSAYVEKIVHLIWLLVLQADISKGIKRPLATGSTTLNRPFDARIEQQQWDVLLLLEMLQNDTLVEHIGGRTCLKNLCLYLKTIRRDFELISDNVAFTLISILHTFVSILNIYKWKESNIGASDKEYTASLANLLAPLNSLDG